MTDCGLCTAECGLRIATVDCGLRGLDCGFIWQEGRHRLQGKGGLVKGRLIIMIIFLNNPLCGFQVLP